MKVGDVFDLPDYGGGHTNFALEVFADGSAIICNFTDYVHRNSDKTCVVEIGEHPCITKKSVVNFIKSDHCQDGVPMDALLRLVTRHHKDPLSPALLARIRQAALDSIRTPDVIKTALRTKK
jgi:hypothetical protein